MGVRLPSEYQQVEYLESTGTQYIVTNFSPANNIGIRVTIQKTVTEQNIPVFGLANIGESTGGATYSNYYHITPYNNRWYLGLNGREAAAGTYNDPVGAIYQIDFNNQNHDILVNGEIIYSNASFSNPYEKTIAISYRGQTNNHKSGKWKYFGFIIYNNQTSEDLANLIPCYRKSDDNPGMYDLVSGTFFVNQGTGEFTVGPDVIDSISPWLVTRRRGLIAGNNMLQPIYTLTNYDFMQGKLDTGVMLAGDGSSGYTIVLKVDCSENTDSHTAILDAAGIYNNYCYIYPTNEKAVYGIQSMSATGFLFFPPSGEVPTWIHTIGISVDLRTLSCILFMNDKPAANRTITFAMPTASLKVNATNRNAKITLEKLAIYSYPMSEAEMRKKLEQM